MIKDLERVEKTTKIDIESYEKKIDTVENEVEECDD